MKNDLDLILSSDKAKEQIMAQVEDWQITLAQFFEENEEYANSYRLIETKNQDRNTFTRTRVGETIRSTEALTTSLFRMLTSQDPNYDLVSMTGEEDPSNVYAAHLQLRYQDIVLKWKRKLLRSLRGLTLFGTQFVENPWVTVVRDGKVVFEGLDFVPRSLLQCAFDPHVLTPGDSKWCAFIDYVSDDWLRDRAEEDPLHWNGPQIEKAIENGKGSTETKYSSRLSQRRQKAGYKDGPKNEVITFYGKLRDFPREDKRMWVVRIVNGTDVVSAFGNPSPTGSLPMKSASYVEFENEPLGYGVGRLGRIAQKHLDFNRIRGIDVATWATYMMFLKNSGSGIQNSSIRFKPLGIVEGGDISENGIRPFGPNLSAVDVALKMEELFRAEFQGNTGATPNLQAQTTRASATEAGLAQNEALRRISVVAEDIGDAFIRDYQTEKHQHNLAWLETDQYLAMPGKSPMRVNRLNLAQNVHIFIRIVTDKDFRPERLGNLMQYKQYLTSVRQRPNILIDDSFIDEEIARSLDIDPKRVIRDQNDLPPANVLNYLVDAQNRVGKAAEMGGDVVDGLSEATMDTPAGPVAVTP